MRWSILGVLVLTGCIRNTVDNLVTQSVIPEALLVADVDRACHTGSSLGYALVGVTRKTPHRAMVIADATAALCDDERARAFEVDSVVAREPSAILDARERERRARSQSAARFHSAWKHAEAVWGPLGEGCPKLKEKEELTFMVGLVSGTIGMLHDKASGSEVGVPLDTLARVSRASTCIDGWWDAPDALEATAWAVIAGSGPEGVDPWQQMETAAASGAAQGMRLGWALTAVVAANAGDEARVRNALERAAASYDTVPGAPDALLLDRYAYDLLLHQADLIWAAEEGHRAPGLTLPKAPPPPAELPDVFTDDPFAQ